MGITLDVRSAISRLSQFAVIGKAQEGWSASCFKPFRTISIPIMLNSLKNWGCAAAAVLAAVSVLPAQTSVPNPAPGASPAAKAADGSSPLLVQAPAQAASPAAKSTATTGAVESDSVIESGGVGVREFQGDDVGQVLRLLARQAKINVVVSEAVTGTVTMRLEDVTALQAISIIVKAKGLFMDKIDSVYYIKTAAERTAEPTESDSYVFSYARAKTVAPLVAAQLASKDPPQVDERTNTLFYRETRSNIDHIRTMLIEIDKPTRQVMIEARLVEVSANPVQAYGINWAGTVGSSTAPKTVSYGGFNATAAQGGQNIPTNGLALGNIQNNNVFGSVGHLANIPQSMFAILSIPQMSATIQALNEDSDAEFLANPRVVTADNQQAKIEISTAQPIPQLTFNAQTATYQFSGFDYKKFGNFLVVTPSINKDNFITLGVKPEISTHDGDVPFTPPGGSQPILGPIINTRTLDSNVLIKSGDTLALAGLLSDQLVRARTKVPLLGDIPLLGNAFQSHDNTRTKRNLLVFVTPTIVDSRYGTGLEDQVSGLHHSGDEYADPNGWRNNAKGAVRLVPTSNRQSAADYAKPGIPPPPEEATDVQFKSTANDRDF